MILVDTVNLFYCTRKAYSGAQINYSKYLEYLENCYGEQDAFAYVARVDASAQKFIDCLRHIGYTVIVKEPRYIRYGKEETFQTNWNVEITIKALQDVSENEPIIIGSNSVELLPLLKALKKMAPLVVVYAVGVPNSFSRLGINTQEISSKIMRLPDGSPVTT